MSREQFILFTRRPRACIVFTQPVEITAGLQGVRAVHQGVTRGGLRGGATLNAELCLNLGDAHHQAARFLVSLVTSTPSLNLIPSITFGN
jgi:hypothetical protein